MTITQAATVDGHAYHFATGIVTRTTSNESALLYVKNTDAQRVLLVTRLHLSLGLAAADGHNATLRIYPNPTPGGVLATGAAVDASNANVGLLAPAQTVTLLGGEGGSISETSHPLTFIFASGSYQAIETLAAIPFGSAIAFSIQPPTGNIAMDLSLIVDGFYISADA
jgi:hypothetical protein